ncbi:MAG: 60 kDa chaperonin [Parcubacteria group bacterium GW2011_GWB1_57_6]|nr:MAG: 60 kDa chaperonin [Parcubacteria group bacterium GW2011_GWA1_56_13]KKW45812.1 MAG: 60 kDa chaperonin [Parcubacteria group bacterium GW2011_GWB1_57_6]
MPEGPRWRIGCFAESYAGKDDAASAAALLLTTEAAVADIPESKKEAPAGEMGMDY